MSKHKKGKANKPNKPNKPKPDTTLVTVIQKNEEPQVKLVDNQTGKLVPTKEDKQAVEEAKEAIKEARQKKLEAREAERKAKDKIIALNSREAIKSLKAELEAKIKAKEAELIKAREAFKAKVDEYNSLLSEYKELTGISKKAVKVNSKGKRTGNRLTGDGDWTPTVKTQDKAIKVIVKHNPSNDLFEYSLFADEDGNGMIPHSAWIDLRHAFTKHYQTVYDSLDKGAKANFRAFLYPRLYTLISNVKAIADKV